MAIVKMNKFTLFTFENKKEALLEKLQRFEAVQFIDLQSKLENEDLSFLKSAEDDKEILNRESDLSKIKFSLEFLKPYINKESGIEALKKGKKVISFDELEEKVKNIDWMSIYEELREREEELNSFENEKTKIESEIEALLPWSKLDCSFQQLKNLRYTSCLLGTIPTDFKESLSKKFQENIDYSYLEIINEEKDDAFFLAIVINSSRENASEILKEYGFTQVNFNYDEAPVDIIEGYRSRLKEIYDMEEKFINDLKELKDYKEKLEVVYEYYSNRLKRSKASLNFVRTNNIIGIEGWSTIALNNELEDMIKEVVGEEYYLEFQEATEEENVPILLKNNGVVEPFESITEMYSLPNYREIDPTPILSIFYFIFFGMMLSDAGYGILMIGGTTIALKFFNLEKETKNFMKLFLYLGISTAFWGAIYGGWFGDAPKAFFGKAAPMLLNQSEDVMDIFLIAVIFGIVHIIVGLAIKAYILIRDKKYIDAVYDVGLWYVSLAGIFMMLSEDLQGIGKIVMIIGFVGLVLTQGRDAETIGGKIGGGIYGLYGITGYVGDIVSYSRLLALGLATGFIANAFNLMINLIPGAGRIIVGPIIFIAGHVFNLGVNVLGAYVHTSRLQYLEFFNKFYEGGGKKFTPFKAENKYINITSKKQMVVDK